MYWQLADAPLFIYGSEYSKRRFRVPLCRSNLKLILLADSRNVWSLVSSSISFEDLFCCRAQVSVAAACVEAPVVRFVVCRHVF